jgi:hypothetical protein
VAALGAGSGVLGPELSQCCRDAAYDQSAQRLPASGAVAQAVDEQRQPIE